MRRIPVVSSTYVDPANRGKLRALAARELDVTVGVPQRWREAGLGRTLEVGWERQGGVEVFPIPVTGSGKADRLRYAGRALASLLRDRSEEHTSELQSPCNLVCRLLLEKKKKNSHSGDVNAADCTCGRTASKLHLQPRPGTTKRRTARRR